MSAKRKRSDALSRFSQRLRKKSRIRFYKRPAMIIPAQSNEPTTEPTASIPIEPTPEPDVAVSPIVMKGKLLPSHMKMLEESAIREAIIKENGYFSIIDEGIEGENRLIELGFPKYQVRKLCPRPGLVLPAWSIFGGEPKIFVYRPDNPPEFEEKSVIQKNGEYKRKRLKYVWPKDTPPALYCPPASRHLLKDTKLPVYWTEGQKKTDALLSQGLCAIGLPNGVWGWRNQQGALADMEAVPWDRDHVVVFDNDVATNPNVAEALKRFSNMLKRRVKGKVTVALVPALKGVKGVDDFFGVGHSLETFEYYMKAGEHLYTNGTDKREQSGKIYSPDYQMGFDELGYSFAFNEAGAIYEMNGQPIDDRLTALMIIEMLDYGNDHFQSSFSKDRIMLEWKALTAKNSYHPIKEYMEKCLKNWDSMLGRIQTLAEHVKDDNEEEYREAFSQEIEEFEKDGQKFKYKGHETFYIFLKRWLIGVVAKLFSQARTQNMMIVLVGEKGKGKSYMLRWLVRGLGDNYAIEDAIKPDDKDYMRRATRCLLWEVPELGSTVRKADVESLKRFITQEIMTFRAPFDAKDTSLPAVSNFFGTVNDDGAGFLYDPSGKDRRFWPVTVMDIDQSYSDTIDVNQLWGEVMYLYTIDKQTNFLTEQEKQLMHLITDRYDVKSPYTDYIRDYYEVITNEFLDDAKQERNPNYDSFVKSTDIATCLKDNAGIRAGDRQLEMEIARSMRALKVRKSRDKDVGRPRGYLGLVKKQIS